MMSAAISTMIRCGWSWRRAAYMKETGDWSILDELVPFDNQPGSEAAAV